MNVEPQIGIELGMFETPYFFDSSLEVELVLPVLLQDSGIFFGPYLNSGDLWASIQLCSPPRGMTGKIRSTLVQIIWSYWRPWIGRTGNQEDMLKISADSVLLVFPTLSP